MLADTNRGAIVQSMSAFIDDPFLGNARFGPVGSAPTWPHVATIRARPETTTPSGNALAAGGFVSERNALIDERGKPSGLGTEYASNCQNVASLSYLGPMPSFYVADPVSSSLHAVTTSLGSTSGGGRDQTAPLDAAIDLPPLLLSADTDGNAGYYQAQHCLDYQGSSDCRRVYLGDAEVHYVVENVETSSVVLQQPPKHVDYLPELGGMVDVSMSPAYYAEFAQTTTASGRIDQRGTVDLTFGEKVGGSVGKPTLPGRDFNALLDLTLDAELQTVAESFAASQATVSLSQTTGAVDDDVIWSRVQTVDYWRFPAQGGKSVGDANSETRFGDEAYVEVAIPEEPVTVIGPGVLNDNYQPTHQPGNILTYPTITGDVTDIGELFNFLGSYLPTDPNGARPCLPLSVDDLAGCVISVNDALVRVAEITTEDAFIGGEFQTRTNPVDVADTLQVGGITYSAELEFSEDVRRGQNVTNKVTLKAETNANVPIKIPVKGIPVQVGTLEAQFRAAASYEEARLAENTLSTETRIALHVPAEIPVERSYRIRPSFGFTPAGSLDVRYQVGTSGVSAPFWQRHYSAPDPALNMPHRIVRRPEGWRLGTDFSRNRIKGFFARDGSGIDPSQPPGTTVGPVLTAAPAAGEPVQLEARVYNLSVATAVEGLTVEFSAQPYENGAAVGTAIPLGATVLDYIPYRGQFADDANAHIASAYLLWDTAGFGPLPGNTLATYVINVTLDPGDGIPGERHELFDRFQDPLIGPVGEPIDPALEKGQNNRGWAMVRIAPPVGTSTAPLLQSLSTAGPVTAAQGVVEEPVTLSFHANGEQPEVLALEARLGEPLELSIALDSSRLHRGYGLLQVFDGPPDQGGEVILSRTVQGLSGAQRTWEPFTWRANAAGPRVLHAVYRGSGLERDAVGKLAVLVSR